ncbi:MAG: hypothetical protein PHD81_02060 [Candidatus Nanoarchaeia archaeon]|nr:hypothetical protein [Candidatus Nanoarchaeia archaeon]MDD5587874.1 hypothetical protein [Candidatus Nanoarchaeia archaeon]
MKKTKKDYFISMETIEALLPSEGLSANEPNQQYSSKALRKIKDQIQKLSTYHYDNSLAPLRRITI